MPAPDILTQTSALLERMGQGEDAAADQLFVLLYDELHKKAKRAVGPGTPTLQATAVVNEMWLRLARGSTLQASNRQHFLRIAARAIRGVVVDYARGRSTQKRDGGERQPLDEALLAWQADATIDPVVLDELLTILRQRDERLADVVDLRFFGGLSEAETADVLAISRRQVQHAWRLAKAFMQRELERGGEA